jgi:hypothetical protein
MRANHPQIKDLTTGDGGLSTYGVHGLTDEM